MSDVVAVVESIAVTALLLVEGVVAVTNTEVAADL